MKTFDLTHHRKQVSLSLKDTFRVALPAQMGTGYSWQWRESGAFELIGQRVQQHKSKPGVSEEQVFLLRPLKKGSVKIVFTYQRPWEKHLQKTFELRLDIEK